MEKPLKFFFWRGGVEVEGPCFTISLLSIQYQLGGFQDNPKRQLSIDVMSTSQCGLGP